MKTDRELLELAAKAIGIELAWSNFDKDLPPRRIDTWNNWNPLTNDGDALRLAVKLGLYLEIDRPNQRASALPEIEEMEFSRENFGADACAALRRAIVRAAAVIGETMP